MATSGQNLPEACVAALRQAKHIAVMTGAGISAESGIPTFREAQTGLWARYRPEELATPEAFMRDPKLVWDWYQWRRELVAKAKPNPGHHALVNLEKQCDALTLITQNVDGFHAQAGNSRVLELHGNIQRTKCFDAHHPVAVLPEEDGQVPPRCPQCQSLLRPDVVWFGEALPAQALEAATHAAQTCDLFLSIGTSSVVYPAAGIVNQAMQRGAVTVEINLTDTPASAFFTHTLRGPAGDILPQLLQAAWPEV